MSKHTPGPWKFEAELPSGPSLGDATTIFARGEVIGRIYESAGKGNAQANARLVDASPEMYLALRAVVATAEQDPFCSVGHLVEHVWPRIRAVLAEVDT